MAARGRPDPFAPPSEAAQAADLWYVTDRQPGIRRVRRGGGFVYRDSSGGVVRNRETLARVSSLAIPPAWTEVWICGNPDGHLQATGRDGRGRKQYRYHHRWRQIRDATKYQRMLHFGAVLPAIRRRVRQDLLRPGLPREKVLAAVVRLLETTLVRVGNEEYARSNGSFGLSTLRDRHVLVKGEQLRFRFPGKGGKVHEIGLRNQRLAGLVRRCRDLPGQELFQYLDENGEPRPVSSGDVNGYLKEITGEEFTAKDFRTWAGTLLMARLVGTGGTVREAIRTVAEELRNTPAVCRKCYIHPALITVFEDPGLRALWSSCRTGARKAMLTGEESALIRFLRRLRAWPGRPTPRSELTRTGAPGRRAAKARSR